MTTSSIARTSPRLRRLLVAAIVCACVTAPPRVTATAQDPQRPGTSDDTDVREYAPVTRRQTGVFNGAKIAYTVTAGRQPLTGPDGSVDAQVFYVAYVKDDAPAATRPLTFLMNGGPGAATAWLHMGGVGPRKVALNADGSVPAGPTRLTDNADSVLDRTDLVFIDAPGTGFSRLSGEAAKKRMLTRSGDLDAFASFVQGYLRTHGRFASPVYLFGESYGSFRAAGLSDVLIRQGVPLKGVMLLSSALDFGVLTGSMTNDLPYVLLLPSYASIAAFHHRLPGNRLDDDSLRQDAAAWALSVYAPALAKGSRLTTTERETVVQGLTRFTGLDASVISANDLRIEVTVFMAQLNAATGMVTGRTDGRLVGPPPRGRVEEPFYDPAMGALTPAFTSAASQYLFGELGVSVPLSYRMYSRDVASRFVLADTGLYGNLGYPEALSALQSSLVKHTDFRVLSMQGIYDLATPYWATEYSLDHMPLPAAYLANVTHARLRGGHMAYDDEVGLRQMRQAIVSFIDGDRAGTTKGR